MEVIKSEDIAWLAGILEGEGYFNLDETKSGHVYIALGMTDKDVVERVGKLWDRPVRLKKRVFGCRMLWIVKIYGGAAREWMRLIRPYMGIRRGKRIDYILEYWRKSRRKLRLVNASEIS
jgi:hypothetical protein